MSPTFPGEQADAIIVRESSPHGFDEILGTALPTISTKELASLDPTPILQDMREEKEFVFSHLPGAQRAESAPVSQLR